MVREEHEMKDEHLTPPVHALLATWLLAAGLAAPSYSAEVVVGKDNEIFGTAEAAEMVRQARQSDPSYSRDANLEKAIELYEKAIELQAGAKINAVLASRIAQIYAYTTWPGTEWRTRWAKAIVWWRRCIQATSPRQLLWVHAQMGLGSTTFLARKPDEAVAAFEAVLAADPERMELPDWKVWRDPSTERGQRERQEELARIRSDAQRARIVAVEKIHYVMMRADRKAAAGALLKVARQYEGTPVGQRAAELADQALKATSHES
jgi:tetratricopeptide (TPR) repeat protein